MYNLNNAEAQTIVDRMMEDNNINIMNHLGFIIGSGNASRIGSIHYGAVQAIEQRRTVEIYDDEELVKCAD